MHTFPASMRVAVSSTPGGPDTLGIAHCPRPDPGPGEVLLKVRAAGVNRADCLQRAGRYPVPAGASDILGLECAGEVVALGAGAMRWRLGDAVCALLVGGGYAEFVTVPEGQCLRVPSGLTWDEAAALMETCCTVWSNVHLRAQLQTGETLLVHGGSSGIGTTALQIFSALGHRIWTTAGSARKCEACRALGAHRAIDYRNEDFVDIVLSDTDGRGVDVILDMVGGMTMQRNLAALADDGRIAGIAASEGRVASIDLLELYRRRQTISGSALRREPAGRKARIVASAGEHVWPLVAQRRVCAVVDSVFPLEAAAAAHARMESGAHIGKIVLRVG